LKPTPGQFFIPIGGANYETRLEKVVDWGYQTPDSLFFVRSHENTPFVDVANWRLVVKGDGIDNPLELSFDDILALPAVKVTRYLECAGNGRSFYASQMNKPAQGGQWHFGAYGVAEWTGVPLSEILKRAKIRKGAIQVMATGLDGPKIERPISVDKAMQDDVILAYLMNGDLLPRDHGFPVRTIVPGWVGINSIKWVGAITVSEKPIWTDKNTNNYVFIGPDYTPPQGSPAKGPPVNEQVMKSAVALPWPAYLKPGKQTIKGMAWSPNGTIAKVEVSLDGGKTWQPAKLGTPNTEKAGVPWTLDADLKEGQATVTPRATDDKGNVQYDVSKQKWNQQGYVYGAYVPHPVIVTNTLPTPTPVPTVQPTAAVAAGTPVAAVGGSGSGQTAAVLAAAGKTVYQRCVACHGPEGQGMTGPALWGTKENLKKYGDAGSMYSFIHRTMPFDAPGSLTDDQYMQVTAYLLLQNQFVQPNTQLSQSSLKDIALK
jgi:DMSO/TMAO reductase YedYZ molybdopterin-dependent catalytic subunit/mono/diheme cytochrome c family protein